MKHQHIFLVDDDEAIRHSASFMLRHAGYTVKTFPDGLTFLEAISPDDIGCVLLDVRMPGMDGLEVQTELKARGITLPVIILTGHGDVPVAVQAMKAGAVEFLEKPYEKQALIDGITTAFDRIDSDGQQSQQAQAAKARITGLTGRELEVLNYLVDGLTNKEIAEKLSISPRTVEIHRANMMEKLQADTLSAALRIAFLAQLGS